LLLLLDNYDSFTFNLAQYLGELGAPPVVRRNDEISLDEIGTMQPDHIVIKRFGPTIPVLGVCLGHQSIGVAFGGQVVRASQLMHGKTSSIQHDGRGVFRGVQQPFVAGRYHSLVVAEPLPDSLETAARTEDGTIMGVRHRTFPVHGVQFHPESVLTGEGRQLLRNFLEM
jgi:anthranilate synthase/aminodeoxychorismate synthase-like glutamine amidotransferase